MQKNKDKDKDLEIIERKKLLLKTLTDNKLEFNPYGDHYSYIYYNKPDLETIVNQDLLELKTKQKKALLLAKQLKKLNIPLDETLPSCYKYINDVGTNTDINLLLKNIEIEYFFKYNTEYQELLKLHDDIDTAKEIALKKYLYKNKNSKIDKLLDIKLSFI